MAELAMLADIHVQRTVYPEEVTRQLHVKAQVSESSPIIDRRSDHCATSPTSSSVTVLLTGVGAGGLGTNDQSLSVVKVES